MCVFFLLTYINMNKRIWINFYMIMDFACFCFIFKVKTHTGRYIWIKYYSGNIKFIFKTVLTFLCKYFYNRHTNGVCRELSNYFFPHYQNATTAVSNNIIFSLKHSLLYFIVFFFLFVSKLVFKFLYCNLMIKYTESM